MKTNLKENASIPFSKEILDTVLEDDDTPYGGVSCSGETVFDFLLSIGDDQIKTLNDLNDALRENGIKPVSISANR